MQQQQRTVQRKRNVFELFCSTSSIRGMQKISSLSEGFLKTSWIFFICIMTTILIWSSTLLIDDYLEYTTAWDTDTVSDYNEPFPSLTICSQNPFSLRANELWEKKLIKTPSQQGSLLSKLALDAVKKRHVVMTSMRLYDSFETFYSSISLNDTIELSHSVDSMRYCLYKSDEYLTIAKYCSLNKTEDSFEVKLFSHKDYFNCYSIEGTKPTGDVIEFMILVEVINSREIKELRNSFLIDTLSRGEGLKIVVHENGHYPDIEKFGIDLHPGKMNNIIFSPIRWIRKNTPPNPCNDDQPSFNDLNRQFNYSRSECANLYFQKKMIDSCQCMMNNYPRPHIPSKSIPYCFRIIEEDDATTIFKRFSCCQNMLLERSPIIQEARKQQCKPRCKYTTYETRVSNTMWQINPQKLEILKQVNDDLLQAQGLKTDEAFNKVFTTINQSDPRYIPSQNNTDADETRFTYVSLRRKNRETTIKTQRLVLSLSILLSRLGGLGSLCIGLTAAVAVELVEFAYLFILRLKSEENHSPSFEKNKNQSFKISNHNVDPSSEDIVQLKLTQKEME